MTAMAFAIALLAFTAGQAAAGWNGNWRPASNGSACIFNQTFQFMGLMTLQACWWTPTAVL